MSLPQNLHTRIIKFLSLGVLVFALTFSPSLFSDQLKSIDAIVSESRVSAQTPAPSQSDAEPKAAAESSGDKEEEKSKIDPLKITMGVLAGLVLFLYGVTRMAEGLKALAGDRAKNLVARFTGNRFSGILTGTVATTILDSSSVTIIMVIAMVDAGMMTFAHSLGLVLGSNIGTTVGAQIVAFEINQYAPIGLLIGAGLQFFGRSDRQKQIGLILFGIGLLFFGLDVIDEAMKPFRDYQPFLDLMKQLAENPLQGAAIGALFTILIQSSSATVAIVVTLASQGLISLPAGVAIMLGAEVGTCADTLVASLGRDRGALRTGVFHLLFNVATAAVGITFASQLANLAQSISLGGDAGRQIANAQVVFNVLGVLLVVGFIPLISRLLQKLIPDDQSRSQVPAESEVLAEK